MFHDKIGVFTMNGEKWQGIDENGSPMEGEIADLDFKFRVDCGDYDIHDGSQIKAVYVENLCGPNVHRIIDVYLVAEN